MATTRLMQTALALGACGLTTLAIAAPAGAVDYPPPKNPITKSKAPKGPFTTRTVCAKGCAFSSIQKAVDASKAGDTVKVKAGTYRERVLIKGQSKRYLKLLGDVSDPEKVKLDGKGSKPATRANNGVTVNGADQITIRGFSARNYSGYGFFVVNNNGYTLRNLSAKFDGVYGVYAFNSVGGEISDSVAAWNNDSGFYIGQTPPQTSPVRSFVRNVSAYGNVLGFSGTNMRYVTISKSRWFNNGLGIVPNALSSEKYAGPEDNVITDNDIFLNNFNYFVGAPFKLRKGATGEVAYPVGTGVLLFGSHRTEVTKNRIYGNYLVGVGAIDQLLLRAEMADAKNAAKFKGVDKEAPTLIGNSIQGNVFGNNAANLNGRDIFYDGSGSNNCVGPNTAVALTVPADQTLFPGCPFSGANTFNDAAQKEAIDWTITDPTHEKFWKKAPQGSLSGVKPMEHWTKAIGTP